MKFCTAETRLTISDMKAASRNLSDVAVVLSEVSKSTKDHLRRAVMFINLVDHSALASAAVVQEIEIICRHTQKIRALNGSADTRWSNLARNCV